MKPCRKFVILCLLGISASLFAADQPKFAGKTPMFQVDPDWPKLPNNWVLGDTGGVTIDDKDHIWVLHRPKTVKAGSHSAPPVIEFDAAGKFVRAWGGDGTGYEWPSNEHGIFVDHKGFLWIGGNFPDDTMLLKFTTEGKFVKQFGKKDKTGGNADTQDYRSPADLVVDPKTNEVYVADGYGNRRVIVFDAETGAFKRMWGAFGNKPADATSPTVRNGMDGMRSTAAPFDEQGEGSQQFALVHSIKISRDGLVYVADRPNRRIQVFTPQGKYVKQVFINRKGPSDQSVCGIALSRDPDQEYLYIADYGNSHVIVLRRKTLETLDSFGDRGPAPGQFQGAHHLASDSKGNLYVTEVAPGARIQKFLLKGYK